MSRQDANAGNAGDQLKHALLIEVIERLPRGSGWSYAETHAGAGLYRCDRAACLLEAAGTGEARRGPGSGYARALTALSAKWPVEERDQWYPGSALLATNVGREWAGVRLAEADAAVVDRLATHMTLHAPTREEQTERQEKLQTTAAGQIGAASGALQGVTTDPGIDLYPGSFETHLDDLLGTGPTLLLVDPYYYQSALLDPDEGCLGLRHLEAIVRALSGRDAVLMVFTSRMPSAVSPLPGHDVGAPLLAQTPWQALCADLGCMVTGSVRCFRVAGHPHAVCLAGWRTGARVVADLPGTEAWTSSWLAAPPVDVEIVEEPMANQRDL